MSTKSLREYDWEAKYVSKPKDGNREIIANLLRHRSIKSKSDEELFFNPPEPDTIKLQDFDLLKSDFEKFVKRLEAAKSKGEKVVVYGDYDADGICATAIMWEVLRDYGLDASPFVPSRFKEGYGFNEKGLDSIIKDFDPKLIITVDNGIVAFEATKLARDKGIDVIITDHHNKSSDVPKANLIIHTTKTSGAGISYLLSCYVRRNIKLGNITNGLELCAVGIISDQVSVKHPNRSLIKYGIEKLNKTTRVGLRAIYEQAGIGRNQIGVFEIGFTIAPRLNASGRLYEGIDSLRLLCTTNDIRSKHLAQKLGGYNKERQEIVTEVLLRAEKIAKKTLWKGAVVVADKDFHEGVIGLAASKLSESYGRPAIVFAIGESESKASGRSVEGFDLIKHLRLMDKYLVTAGGHPGAVGFTIKTKDIDEFSVEFDKAVSKTLGDKPFRKSLTIDSEVAFNQINTQLMKLLKSFEPTGVDNTKPIFCTKNVEIISYKLVGSDQKHMKLILRKDGKTFDAIAFSFGLHFNKIMVKDACDVAYFIEENIWNGVSSIDLRIKDIRI